MNTDDKAVAKNGEIGRSGTLIFNGLITSEEYNRDLIGKPALKVYDTMRRSDGTVAAALKACKLPILSADWSIEAASDTAQDIEVADFVRDQLFSAEVNFQDLLREALTMFDFGHSVFEKVYEVGKWRGKTMILLVKLGSRKQNTIYKWETSDKQPGITQFIAGQDNYDIPMDKLIIFTNEREGDNYEGISMLRPAYKHWDIKDKLYLIDAIKLERQGLGIIDVEIPAGSSPQDEADAISAAKNIRANEESYLKKPEGWKIEFMDMKANTTADVMPTVSHHDRQIVKTVLAQFLEIGAAGGGGTRSASQDHSRLFELSLEAAAKNLAATLTKALITQLVDLNYTVAQYPKLNHGKIGDENLTEISDAVQKLVTASAVTPDAEMEQWLRTVLHAPDLPQEYADDYANRPKSGGAVPTLPAVIPDAGNADGGGTDVTASATLRRAIKAKDALIAEVNALYANSGS
jgi:phage gp29-like protein